VEREGEKSRRRGGEAQTSSVQESEGKAQRGRKKGEGGGRFLRCNTDHEKELLGKERKGEIEKKSSHEEIWWKKLAFLDEGKGGRGEAFFLQYEGESKVGPFWKEKGSSKKEEGEGKSSSLIDETLGEYREKRERYSAGKGAQFSPRGGEQLWGEGGGALHSSAQNGHEKRKGEKKEENPSLLK